MKQKPTAHKGLIRTEKKGNITAYKLPKNGLTVLSVRIPKSETVTTSIVYLVGSRHEKTGETGLAHMLEHMLFKPTTGKGVKWKDLENKGAHLNATTWLDRTLYYFTLPKAYFSDMLAVEADRMRNTLLTDKEFLPERTNVLSEYQIHNSHADSVLEWRMGAAAFETHGYHHDTIGFKSDIEAYTTKKLKSFYDRYYRPHNATLIVVGDISEDDLMKHVEKYFSPLERYEAIPDEARVEEEQEGVRRVTLSRPTPLRVINFAWKAPSFGHPDWLPLMLGLRYLDDGEVSPLYKALIETKLATNTSVHLFPTHDPYLAFLSIYTCEHVAYDIVEDAVVKTLKKILGKKISAKKIELLKEALIVDELAERDGTRAVALSLSEYVASGDWRKYTKQIEEIEKISVEQIEHALKTYLTLTKCTIGTLEKP